MSLPEKIVLDPKKDAYLRSLPPLKLSDPDKIIDMRETKMFKDKHKMPTGSYGDANLSPLEEGETGAKIQVNNGGTEITTIQESTVEPEASAADYNMGYVSDEDAKELL